MTLAVRQTPPSSSHSTCHSPVSTRLQVTNAMRPGSSAEADVSPDMSLDVLFGAVFCRFVLLLPERDEQIVHSLCSVGLISDVKFGGAGSPPG